MKKLSAAISSTIAYFFMAAPAFAAIGGGSVDPCSGNASGGVVGALCGVANASIGSTVQTIVVSIVVLAVVIALLYLLYGGIKWIISRGDKSEVEAARNHITAAIVGLIIVFLAIFIVAVVLAIFGISGNDLTLPSIGNTT